MAGIEFWKLPIKSDSLRYETVHSNHQGGPVLLGEARETGVLYVLGWYATKFLVDDTMHGAKFCLLVRTDGWQPHRIPRDVGLSDGGHSVEDVQRVLDKHVAKMRETEPNEFLLGPAGLPDQPDFRNFGYDDELGIFRMFSRSGFQRGGLPKRRPAWQRY